MGTFLNQSLHVSAAEPFPIQQQLLPPSQVAQDQFSGSSWKYREKKGTGEQERGVPSIPDKNTSLSQQPLPLFFNLMVSVTGDQSTEP